MSDHYDDDHEVTEADLDAIAEAIEEADNLHQRYEFLSVPKIPCPDCGGEGQVYGGSLGNACPGCFGARMVDHPSAEKPTLLGFQSERKALGAYIRAQRSQGTDREEPLPSASTLPKPESIRVRMQEIEEASKQLAGVQLQGQLAEQQKQAAGLLGDEDANYTDAELDECEDEDLNR